MTWEILTSLRADLLPADPGDSFADPGELRDALGGTMMALAEHILDASMVRGGDAAAKGYRELQSLFEEFLACHGIQVNGSPDFIAGQLAAFTETLGAAARRRAPDDFERAIKERKFRSILMALQNRELSEVALAREISESQENVNRKLKVLRAAGVIVSHKLGREVHSTLSPAARQWLADRHEVQQEIWEIKPAASAAGVRQKVAMFAQSTFDRAQLRFDRIVQALSAEGHNVSAPQEGSGRNMTKGETRDLATSGDLRRTGTLQRAGQVRGASGGLPRTGELQRLSTVCAGAGTGGAT